VILDWTYISLCQSILYCKRSHLIVIHLLKHFSACFTKICTKYYHMLSFCSEIHTEYVKYYFTKRSAEMNMC